MLKWLLAGYLSCPLGALALHPWLSPHAPFWLPMLVAAVLWGIVVNIVLAVPRLRRWLYNVLQ